MTCIAGIGNGKSVWVGGDSAGVAGYALTVRNDSKVFKNGPFLMGFTTSFRMGQLLRWTLNGAGLQRNRTDDDDEKFMSTAFVDAVRACLKAGGFASKKEEVEEGGTFIVGYKGKIYEVADDYQVGIPADGFAAVGCGFQIAQGSLHSTRESPWNEFDRINMALEAAERFNAGVRAPFRILELEKD